MTATLSACAGSAVGQRIGRRIAVYNCVAVFAFL